MLRLFSEMENAAILIKIKERLNKRSSDDFDNIECWKMVESFNKYQVEWCRRNLRSGNATHEGDEGGISKIDDLQILLETTDPLTMTDEGDFFQSVAEDWPANYLRHKRVVLVGKKDCCDEPKRIIAPLVEEGNVETYLRDVNRAPDYRWRQAFVTLTGNKLNVYHNGEFEIDSCKLMYYRQPRMIQIIGCPNVFDGVTPAADVECEFSDDMVEIFCDGAASIIAGDIENFQQGQRLDGAAERNN
jgi:hypothetical protein